MQETVAHVVVAGAGQAGLRTAASLRERGFAGRVTLVGEEGVRPYERPPLSKAHLTAGDGGPGPVALRAAAYYADREIDLVAGDPVVEIDRPDARVALRSGRSVAYDRLVLALGARARTLPVPGVDRAGVLTLRGLADADRLRAALAPAQRDVVVVGGGYLGLEVAAAARGLGHTVTVVEVADRPLARVATVHTADFLAAEHRRRGVRVLIGHGVRAVHGRLGDTRDTGTGSVGAVELDDGRRLPADVVVVAVGAVPETALAAAAGLPVRAGVVVDRFLRTADPAVYAIGDCAEFPDPRTGAPLRLESVQNADDQGRYVAGHILGAADGHYCKLPWFWTDQFGSTVQIAGVAAGHDGTVVLGDPDAGRFSVLCFAGQRLRAVESVGRPADHVAARRLLQMGTGPSPAEAAGPGFALMDHLRRLTTPAGQDRKAG